MPELMLRYRAATFFGRLYAPDVLMGMQTVEEVHDIGSMKDVTPESPVLANINEAIAKEAAKPTDVDPATGEVITRAALQDMLDDIASAPTADGVDFKATAAMDAHGTDANAAAQIALAKTERKKAIANPPVTPAASQANPAQQPSPAASGDGQARGLFGKPVPEKKPEGTAA